MIRSADLVATTEVPETDRDDGNAQRRDAAGPRAMSRVINLCSALGANPAGLTLSELSALLDTPKSTLLNSLRALVQDDFLVADGLQYRLGPKAFVLAARITSAWSLPRLMAGYLRELRDQTMESVGLAVPDWSLGRAVYIDALQSPRPVLYHMQVGQSAPLYASAAGRLLLAHRPAEFVEHYLRTTRFKQLTPHTVTDPAVIAAELQRAREEGCWVSVSQLIDTTATIAAPIFDAMSNAVAAIAVGGPRERLLAEIASIKSAVCHVARRASGHLSEDGIG